MSAAKHTSGPWDFREGSIYEAKPSRRLVAFASSIGSSAIDARPDDEVDANARLIAAAPELLEALRYAVNSLEAMRPTFSQVKDEGHAYHDQVLDAAKAAIAKASA